MYAKVKSFQKRQFNQRLSYVYLDATITKVREYGQVLNTSMIVDVG